MSAALLASAVDALRLDRQKSASGQALCSLRSFSAAEWRSGLRVLDRTGITLPLYARLCENGDRAALPGVVPEVVIDALERRRRDNQRRMEGMLQTFGQAVRALQHARIPFVCLKGFSLFPEYFVQLWRRHQVDFDFLVAPWDAARARAVLEALGYRLSGSAGDKELRLRIPVQEHMDRDAYMYDRQQGSSIELHTSFWDPGSFDLPLRCPEDALERAEMHVVGDVVFARLSQPHAFVYQVLHVFRHFLGSWARPLWIYEIAFFIHRHRDRDELWRDVRELIAVDLRMADAAALVLFLANALFGPAVPASLAGLCCRPEQDPIRLWVEHFAWRWAVADMPGNKLNLLLHRHFIADRLEWRNYLTSRLLPFAGNAALCEGLEESAAGLWRYKLANLRYRAQRALHHVHADLEFGFASISWNAAQHFRPGRAPGGAITRSAT